MSEDKKITVKVLFFGATAETVGTRESKTEFDHEVSADSAFAALLDRFPELSKQHNPEALLFSVNQAYAKGNEIIKAGDELAVFTAVSGG